MYKRPNPMPYKVDRIAVHEGRRQLNEAAVVRLMESIKRLGMQTPITVHDGGDCLVLISGLHRLEAMKRLGSEFIDAYLVPAATDPTEIRLWEIGENLHRAELTEAERREHIAEWVRLTAEKVNKSCSPLPGGSQPAEAGIRKAARDLGLHQVTVKNAVDAESLSDEVKAAADAIDLGTVKRAKLAAEKDKAAQLAAIDEEARRKAAKAQAAKPSKPAPAIKNAFESEEDWRRALFNVWNRGAQDWRDRAMETIDKPVYDTAQESVSARH